MKKLVLPPRLFEAARWINKDAGVADIGTDHGILPVWLALNSAALSITASDINEAPLSKAKALASLYGVAGKINFMLTPGLEKICLEHINTIVIAGMGGETIASILCDAGVETLSTKKLILQPMSKRSSLKEWLYANGYRVEDESLIKEDGHIYNLFLASSGPGDKPTPGELYVGRALFEKKDRYLPEYLNLTILKLESAIKGMEASNSAVETEKLIFYKTALSELISKRGETENDNS